MISLYCQYSVLPDKMIELQRIGFILQPCLEKNLKAPNLVGVTTNFGFCGVVCTL